jgi:hypothetical protein
LVSARRFRFLVLPLDDAQLIVINVYGGVVQDVYGADDSDEVILIDWDTAGAQPGDPSLVQAPCDGASRLVAVMSLAPRPLRELAGSDIEPALQAACQQAAFE